MIHKRIRKTCKIENPSEGTTLYYCERLDLLPKTEYCILKVDHLKESDPKMPQRYYISNGYLFDTEAFEEYNKFLKTHTKFLRTLISRYRVNLSEPRWAVVYFISRESRHYFYWAIKNLMSGVHFNLIERALNLVFKFQGCSQKLKKGTLAAYSEVKGLYEFFNEFEAIIFEKEVSSAISKFAANQRSLMKTTQLSDDEKKALLLINRIPQDVAKNFIKKMTPCMSVPTIIDELRFLSSNSIVWDKEWVKKFIQKNNLNAEVVFESDDILLVKVKDFNTIRRLGGNTSWCITRRHSFWSNYYLDTPDIAEQYMLFNFGLPEYDDTSIVGFTETVGKGITAMHDFKNVSLVSRNRELKCLYDNYVNNLKGKIIFDVDEDNIEVDEATKEFPVTPEEFLEDVGIDSKLYKKDPFFKWERDSVLEIINSIDNGNHIILRDDGNVLTIMVSDMFAMSVIGFQVDSLERLGSGCGRIYRLDFNKKKEDPERIISLSLNDRSLFIRNNYNEWSATTLKSLLNECGADTFALCKSNTALEKYLLCIEKNNFDEAKEVMASQEFAKEYALAPEYVRDRIVEKWDTTRFTFAHTTLLSTTIPFEHLLSARISPSTFFDENYAWRFLKRFQHTFDAGRGVCSNHKDMLEFEISVFEKIMGVTESSGTIQERVRKAIESAMENTSMPSNSRYCDRKIRIRR